MPRPPEAVRQLGALHAAEALASSLPTGAETERLRTLLEINNAVISNLTREDLFRAIARALHRVIPFERIAIFLRDPARDVLKLFVLESSLSSAHLVVGWEEDPEKSSVGWVFRHRQPLLRRDLEAEREYPTEDLAVADGVRSAVVVPLIARGACLGTLGVASTTVNQYGAGDVALLQDAANQVALAVENMQAFEAMKQEVALRRQAEETLRASEELKSRLIDCSPDCIKLLDLEGQLLSVNAGGMALLEICDLGSVLNTSWIDFWEDGDRQAAHAAVQAARSGGVGRFVGYLPTTVTRKPRWWEVVVTPILDSAGKPEMLLVVSRDVTERRQAEEMLRSLVEGTAPVTGADFFPSLVRHLASALRVRFAFVTESVDGAHGRVRSLAFWKGEGFGQSLEYDVAGTPCQEVLEGKVAFYPRDVKRLFPRDRDLVELGAEGYLGIPIVDASSRVIGHLAILHDKPMEQDKQGVATLKIFAARAGAELERLRASEQIHRLNLEQEVILGINRATGRHLDRNQLFGALSACLKTVVPTEFFGIEMPIEGDKLQGHLLAARRTGAGAERTQPTVLPATGTACNWVIQNREAIRFASRDELRERFPVTFDVMAGEGMESLCALPLVSGNRCRGALFFMAAASGAYQGLDRGFLEQVANAVAVALDNCLAHEEVRQLRDRLEAENVYLQEEIRGEHNFIELVGGSPALLGLLRKVEQVAPADSTVLILGETGTGKELIARAIHSRSSRKDRALVKVDCSAISAGLVESELFGHVKGAFTGALERRVGRFELADGATIFLDEVGELPLETQAKLLRVLQEQQFEPVGSNRTVRVDVRIIAATNRDLREAVRAGRFRSDLFYRLNVFPLDVPPLRERRSDIPQLATFFLARYAKAMGKRLERISRESMDLLLAYPWPGNIRELQNIMERAVILSSGPILELGPDLLPVHTGAAADPGDEKGPPQKPAGLSHDPPEATPVGPLPSGPQTLQEIERRHIVAVLEQSRGVIEGPRGAARVLGLHPNTLRSRMQKLGIKRPRHDIS